MQQFLLQSYFLPSAIAASASRQGDARHRGGFHIFALAHLPNPVLTPITLVWGLIACVLFLRYRNASTPLGIAHGIMGLCVAVTVPNSLHHNMRVGLGYLRYHPSRFAELVDLSVPNPTSRLLNSRICEVDTSCSRS